jgi:diguanylate cyclase (GGDEF)-like protein
VGCLRHEDGSVEVSIAQIVDVTDQVAAERELQRLARIDLLTGLANRGEVIACLESALEPTRGPQSRWGVLFADVDGFKAINDTFGHVVGDMVLTTLASRIRHGVREGDFVGRMGGDEILVLLPGVHSIDEATRIAEKIRRHAAQPLHAAGHTIKVTLSIGAVLAAPGQTASTVLARADAAMYQAKTRRNAVVSFT